MKINDVINTLSDFLTQQLQAPDDDFSHVAFDVLGTMMLLSAVDGNISKEEVVCFKDSARSIGHYTEDEATALWETFLRSAGYLSLRAKVDDPDACIAEFMRLADENLLKKLARATTVVVARATACLESMANADGDFSPIERTCIGVLRDRLSELKERRAVSNSIRL